MLFCLMQMYTIIISREELTIIPNTTKYLISVHISNMLLNFVFPNILFASTSSHYN